MTKRAFTLTVLVLAVMLVAARAHADAFRVTLDTSPLSGPQILGFGLTNFDAADNTVLLSAFDFGGGGVVAGSADCTLGGTFSGLGCSGDLASGVALQDLDPTAAFFTQLFNPGLSLSFLLTTSNSFAGGFPDQFAMFLCDGSFTCYSDDATGAMLSLNLSGGSLSPSSFVRFGASLQNLGAPVVSAVPEPGTLLLVLLGSGLTSVVARGRKGLARQLRRRRV